MFNARDFGAVGDGEHDDGPAILAAVRAASEWLKARRALGEDRDEVIVSVPPGSYALGGIEIPSDVEGVVLRGEGEAFKDVDDPAKRQGAEPDSPEPSG